ncbi:hypothetical protein Tco_0708089 [Tanacetum coccineum]
MMEPTSQGSARPADDEVQQKQAPTEAGVSLTAICSCRYRENDCDVIYGVSQFSILWSSRLLRLSPNNKDHESEPEDNSSSMSFSDSEAELEGCLDLMQLAAGVFGCCCNLQQGCLDAAATCSRGVWMLLQLAAGVFGCCCNLQQGCLDFP